MALDTAPFVDGFPSDPAQPDSAIHKIIDGELRNCDALAGTSGVTNGLLYPAYFAAAREVRAGWLEPALRRFLWNDGRQPWDRYLRGLLKLLVSSLNPPATEESLLLLAQAGPRLETHGPDQCQAGVAIAAALKKRKTPLPPPLVEALDTLVAHLVAIHNHVASTFDVAWRLWRAPENPHDGAPCFSALIRADLRAMEESQRAAWSAFLDLRTADPSRTSLHEPYTGKLRQAIGRIGRERFGARWKGWIEGLAAAQPAALSAAGRDLLLLFLHACGADAAMAMDDTLYRLCEVRWAGAANRLLTKEWLGALLATLATGPAEKAFACAEALIHNPDTQNFVEVHTLYNHLMAELTDEAGQPRAQTGVDDYDLACDPDLYRQQVILDRCLRDASPRSLGIPGVVDTTWHSDQMIPLLVRRQAAADRSRFARAVASRTGWLDHHEGEPPKILAVRQTPLGEVALCAPDPRLFWRLAIDRIQSALLEESPPLEEEDLIALLEADISAKLGSGGESLLAQVSEYVRERGYSVALVQALERWQAGYHGPYAAMEMRHRIGWLLWMEDAAPIREEDCWSHRIRQDLRRMPPKPQAAWKALFENTDLAMRSQPEKAWQMRAAEALGKMSAKEFRTRLREWLEPFRAGEPLHLTVCGRDVLRNLMWCALVAKDPKADESVTWFAEADWRTKRDQECSESLLPAWVYVMAARSDELAYAALEALYRKGKASLHGKCLETYRELCARLDRQPSFAEPPPKALDPYAPVLAMIERIGAGDLVRLENDRLVVSGVRDTYEIDLQDSSMRRRSDGRAIRLELDLENRTLKWLRPMLDSSDLSHPFRPNYFRISICARMLLHDDINAGSIVAESD